MLCGEVTVCSGTVAVLLTAANRTGVERWGNVVWRGNSVFRNCGCTVDSSKQDSVERWRNIVWRGNSVFRNCGCNLDSSKQDRCRVGVKHCCVER